MANPQKDKGSKAEREVAALLNDELGLSTRRALGAGRKDDVGDIHGLPDTVVQVANYASLDRAVREKLSTVEHQMKNAGAQYGALWCRRRGGSYVVVMSSSQYLQMWRETQSPVVKHEVTQRGTSDSIGRSTTQ